jgi:hypothetical protein
VSRPFVSDEQLLAYLLGALSPHEQLQITQLLEHDASLRSRVKILESQAAPVTEISLEPIQPGGLVANVMDQIQREQYDASYEDASSREGLPAVEAKIRPSDFSEISGTVNWLDFLTFSICGMVLISLISPTVVHYREAARASQCSSRLSELGVQVQDFANRSQNRTLPDIPVSGPFAFAGVYAIRLNDAGLMSGPQVLWCPSIPTQKTIVTNGGGYTLPSAGEFASLPEAKQEYWRHVSGGSFAYNLGFIDQNDHRMPLVDDEADIAILADAPLQIDGDEYLFSVHRGDACNVLYDDGRVELIRINSLSDPVDHPFFNRIGKIEAGLDENDSALGSSFVSPLGTFK